MWVGLKNINIMFTCTDAACDSNPSILWSDGSQYDMTLNPDITSVDFSTNLLMFGQMALSGPNLVISGQMDFSTVGSYCELNCACGPSPGPILGMTPSETVTSAEIGHNIT